MASGAPYSFSSRPYQLLTKDDKKTSSVTPYNPPPQYPPYNHSPLTSTHRPQEKEEDFDSFLDRPSASSSFQQDPYPTPTYPSYTPYNAPHPPAAKGTSPRTETTLYIPEENRARPPHELPKQREPPKVQSTSFSSSYPPVAPPGPKPTPPPIPALSFGSERKEPRQSAPSVAPSPSSSSSELDYKQEHDATIQPLLMAIDSMREILSDMNIKIPSIVVVGDQSSGKSSVLEALSGIGLPRGNGIVTRCPLILKLVRQKTVKYPHATLSNSMSTQPSQMTSLDGMGHMAMPIEISDLSRVGEFVSKLTSIMIGSDHGIASTPLYLTVFGPSYPDLTLIDLPGITRNAIQGQAENIYEQITSMIQHFIVNPETIILNIVPASSDLSTSEGILLARRVDPEGRRTLVVATKPDTVDNSRIVSVLETMVDRMRLKLGIVVVRNRTSDEVDQNLPFHVAREREVEFFSGHPVWKDKFQKEKTRKWTSDHVLNGLDASQKVYMGVPALTKILVTLQSQAVRRAFPHIKHSVSESLMQHKEELAGMPRAFASASEYRMHFGKILSESMNGVQKYFSNADYSLPGDKEEFHIYPRLKKLYEDCDHAIKTNLTDPFTEVYAVQIQKIMVENEGRNITSVESINVFRTLIKEEVKLFTTPMRHTVEEVQVLVERVLFFIISQQCSDFLHIESKLKELTKEFVQTKIEEAWAATLRLMDTESYRSFTSVNFFEDTSTKLLAEIMRILFDLSDRKQADENKSQFPVTVSNPPVGNEPFTFPATHPYALSTSISRATTSSAQYTPKPAGGTIHTLTRKFKSLFQSSSANSSSRAHHESSSGRSDQEIEDSDLGAYYNRNPIPIDINNLSLDIRSIEMYKINCACGNDKNRFESVLKTQVNVFSYTQWFLMVMNETFVRHIDSYLLKQVSGYGGLYARFQEFLNSVRDEDIHTLMSESAEVKERREKCMLGIKKLEQATRIIEKALA